MKKLVFGLIATVVLGFAGNAQSLRAKFLEGKTYDQVLADFNKLDDTEKTALWVEKMDQLLNVDLPKENKVVISEIRDMLLKNGFTSKVEGFVDIAIKLAKLTPLEDFVKMIESLDDYKYENKFIGSTDVPENIINDIMNINNTQINISVARVPCSCRWCIGFGDHTYTDCTHSEYGCGFLWFQSCTKGVTGL